MCHNYYFNLEKQQWLWFSGIGMLCKMGMLLLSEILNPSLKNPAYVPAIIDIENTVFVCCYYCYCLFTPAGTSYPLNIPSFAKTLGIPPVGVYTLIVSLMQLRITFILWRSSHEGLLLLPSTDVISFTTCSCMSGCLASSKSRKEDIFAVFYKNKTKQKNIIKKLSNVVLLCQFQLLACHNFVTMLLLQ